MKSQVAKRINVNLTQKDLDNLNWATENIWTGTKNPRKTQASEIIRDALQVYVETMGKNNNNP